MGYNTLKKRKLLKALETSKTMREAGIKAGYTPISHTIYTKPTKTYLAEAIASSPELIKQKYEELHQLALLSKDYSTARGVLQDLARINALFLDRSEIKTDNTTNLKMTREEMKERINRISHLLETQEVTKPSS